MVVIVTAYCRLYGIASFLRVRPACRLNPSSLPLRVQCLVTMTTMTRVTASGGFVVAVGVGILADSDTDVEVQSALRRARPSLVDARHRGPKVAPERLFRARFSTAVQIAPSTPFAV